MAVIFSAFSFRLVHIQLTDHEKYATKAAEKHVRQQIIYARRGAILDTKGEVLADNEPVRNIVIDATHVTEPSVLVDILSSKLDINVPQLTADIAAEKPYIRVQRNVNELVALDLQNALSERDLRGVYYETGTKRIYPNSAMLGHTLGYLALNDEDEYVGVEGIERMMDEQLRGEHGHRRIERDRTGRELVIYRGQHKDPRDGYNIRLTIEMGLQQIVESELDAAMEKYQPENASVILMRPRTGEILAIASRPHYDPNHPSEATNDSRINRAIMSLVEPGSTFKIVPTGAAFNESLVTPETMIFCENGRFQYGGRSLKDHRPYGSLSVHNILVKSSNIGTAKLAIQMGDQKFYEYIRRFGFGEKTGLGLPGEIAGILHPVHRWSGISITRIPMGHEIGTTPIQMVNALSVIANGGLLMRPQIVHSITDASGQTIKPFAPEQMRRVLSRDAARAVHSALVDVTQPGGTATRAQVPGFPSAGKTGTAQKPSPTGGYMQGKYVLTFVGYLPAENPAYAAVVLVDNPSNATEGAYGGLIAAPIFAEIGKRAMRYLDLRPAESAIPDEPEIRKAIPVLSAR